MRVVSWQGGKGGWIVRWQVWKGRRVARWQIGRVLRWHSGDFLVLFKGGGCRVSPRSHLLVSDLTLTKKQDVLKIFLHGRRDGKNLLRSYPSC